MSSTRVPFDDHGPGPGLCTAGPQAERDSRPAAATVTTLAHTLIDLQRTAGNAAVTGALARGRLPASGGRTPALQRDTDQPGAPGAGATIAQPDRDSPIERRIAMWGESVMARLGRVRKSIATDKRLGDAVQELHILVIFVFQAIDEVPTGDPRLPRLVHVGRTVEGLAGLVGDQWRLQQDALAEREAKQKPGAATGGIDAPGRAASTTDVVAQLRVFRQMAAKTEPWLKRRPRGGKGAGPESSPTAEPGAGPERTPAEPGTGASIHDAWRQGVILRLGRAIVQGGRGELSGATYEVNAAAEIVHWWRTEAPKGEAVLRLAALERSLYYAALRLQQLDVGPGDIDLLWNLDVTEQEARVVGQAIGWKPEPGEATSTKSATPPGASPPVASPVAGTSAEGPAPVP